MRVHKTDRLNFKTAHFLPEHEKLLVFVYLLDKLNIVRLQLYVKMFHLLLINKRLEKA